MNDDLAPRGGGRWMAFVVFGFVILLAAVIMLAVGGSFWGWMATGALVLLGGLALVVHLARRNRTAV